MNTSETIPNERGSPPDWCPAPDLPNATLRVHHCMGLIEHLA